MLNKPATRDILLIGLITIILVVLGLTVHWTEAAIDFMYRYQDLPVDDIAIPMVVTAFLLIIYVVRRNREYREMIKIYQLNLKELNQTNGRLNMLLHSSAAIIWNNKLDDQFTILYFSDNITSILGYTMEEAMAEGFWKANLHPDEVDNLFADMPEMYKAGKWIRQYHFRHKNGTWRWMHADISVIYNQDGKPVELVGVWLDITEKKKAQEAIRKSEERLQYASMATRDVLYDWNLSTNEPWYSEQVFTSLGYARSTEFTEDWWIKNLYENDRETIQLLCKEHLDQKKQTFYAEYRFRRGDGTYTQIIDRAYIIYDKDGMPLRWIGSMYDVTELRRHETELLRAKEHAEVSAHAKSEFLANMSHEIRTPLNGILGMTEIALDTNLTTDQRRYLEIVRTSCNSLMSLINDILDFSKIEAGKMELSLTPFSLRDELPEIMQPLGLKASEKKLEFVLTIGDKVPDLLVGDFYRIHQVLTNLVGNAIKFTAKGQIVVDIQVASQENDNVHLQFSVTDTGIGIPQSKLAAIFEAFTQADGSTTRKFGGSGLGLTITKKLVELMGGTIWLESKAGQGSTFYFTLKLKLQAVQNAPRFKALPVLENTPVLVVEDNLLSQKHLLRLLENFQMKAVGVQSGEEALVLLQKHQAAGQPFKLLILDLQLEGDMDGYALATTIKTDTQLKGIRMLVVTMSQKASDRERMSQLGIDQYFTKPFSQSDLLDSVQNVLLSTDAIAAVEIASPRVRFSACPVKAGHTKILLAEDNLVNQEVANLMLQKSGYQVRIANNGAEALAMYQNEKFDMILMDVQMPQMNGYEATMKIRDWEKKSGKHTWIIGLTANAMKGDREHCLNAGMDDYLSKPMRMKDLLVILEKVSGAPTAARDENGITHPVGPLVCLQTLLDNLDGNKELMRDILKDFRSRAIDQLSNIQSCLAKNEISQMRMPAHSLKGQCMNVEMRQVIDLAAKMEELSIEGKTEEAHKLMPALQMQLNLGLNALEVALAGTCSD